MPNLYESLQQKMGRAAPTGAPQAERIGQVLRAKRGKAVQRRGPRATAVAEEAEIAAGRGAMREEVIAGRRGALAIGAREEAIRERGREARRGLRAEREVTGGALAAEAGIRAEQRQARAQEAKGKLRTTERTTIRNYQAKSEQALAQLASERKTVEADIFEQFRQSNEDLDYRKDAAELEQLAHTMMMRDTAYIDEITRVAHRRGLEDEATFREEMSRQVLGDDMNNLFEELDWKRSYNQAGRDWTKKMQQMSIDQSMQVLKMETRQKNKEIILSGGTDVAAGYMAGPTRDTGGTAGGGTTGAEPTS